MPLQNASFSFVQHKDKTIITISIELIESEDTHSEDMMATEVGLFLCIRITFQQNGVVFFVMFHHEDRVATTACVKNCGSVLCG